VSAAIRQAYVVDDDEPFRRSLTTLLESAGWQIEAFDSAGAFAERASALDPGILLLDLHLGAASGLDLIEDGHGEMERFAVVMVTGAGEIETAVRSMKAGAVDFIEKPFDAGELLDRLDGIARDFAALLETKSARWHAQRRIASLSPRERDVLERLLSGASNKRIARALELSPRTVEMHRARMVAKLGVSTTAEALEVGRLAGVTPVSAEGQAGPGSSPEG
jgi:two-component system, LuxR family, response regulator FixJ